MDRRHYLSIFYDYMHDYITMDAQGSKGTSNKCHVLMFDIIIRPR